jgi:hypothetical protein
MPLTVPRTSTDVDFTSARAHLIRNIKNYLIITVKTKILKNPSLGKAQARHFLPSQRTSGQEPGFREGKEGPSKGRRPSQGVDWPEKI